MQARRKAVKPERRRTVALTIRLAEDSADHLMEIEQVLRRRRIRQQQGASASGILEALVRDATPDSVERLLRALGR